MRSRGKFLSRRNPPPYSGRGRGTVFQIGNIFEQKSHPLIPAMPSFFHILLCIIKMSVGRATKLIWHFELLVPEYDFARWAMTMHDK